MRHLKMVKCEKQPEMAKNAKVCLISHPRGLSPQIQPFPATWGYPGGLWGIFSFSCFIFMVFLLSLSCENITSASSASASIFSLQQNNLPWISHVARHGNESSTRSQIRGFLFGVNHVNQSINPTSSAANPGKGFQDKTVNRGYEDTRSGLYLSGHKHIRSSKADGFMESRIRNERRKEYELMTKLEKIILRTDPNKYSVSDFTDEELIRICEGTSPEEIIKNRKENIIGKKFGNWTVLKDSGARVTGRYFDKNCNRIHPHYDHYYFVRCKCGTEKEIRAGDLKSGKSTQCQNCKCKQISRKHGMSSTPEYKTWAGMIARCTNPKETGYKNYGGRGIKVCKRWRNSFENFFADMGKRPVAIKNKRAAYSIDRINNDGNYEPGNCRWATDKQQRDNRRDSKAC